MPSLGILATLVGGLAAALVFGYLALRLKVGHIAIGWRDSR